MLHLGEISPLEAPPPEIGKAVHICSGVGAHAEVVIIGVALKSFDVLHSGGKVPGQLPQTHPRLEITLAGVEGQLSLGQAVHHNGIRCRTDDHHIAVADQLLGSDPIGSTVVGGQHIGQTFILVLIAQGQPGPADGRCGHKSVAPMQPTIECLRQGDLMVIYVVGIKSNFHQVFTRLSTVAFSSLA